MQTKRSAAAPTNFAPTEPMTLEPALAELSLAPVEVTLYEVMAELRRNNRVCPQPTRWFEFYRVLIDASPRSKRPAEPPSASAWSSTPPLAKRMALREHVEWAQAHGCLQAAYDFLRRLPESDWHHME